MSHTASSITLVCYDISSDKLRRKIDKCMKGFGFRLQFSIFLCRLDAAGVAQCCEKLAKVLTQNSKHKDPSDSLIVFQRLHPGVALCLLGERIEHEPPVYKII